ncbi:citramalate synthase [Mobiluncus curtisii]|uniref:Citramalate synthase n=2 Tax=Mobiluncus curtisii TaxID=2051 RepID=D6ZGP8_MOBCV|nr:citramalate synthase [Mobiluncus curtisii]ADI67806.1 2-isopropylmalate synthase/homocitrate synthase family protein [Mobiluncus curtisii ATCC 43063]EFL94316.1 2-isopropylmalate synthase/homocitrate synthase family protein [Mobiluncus curtisii subsp. curtisii ATCC 35241]MCV0021196.1 citramalate synthase [Mobiluncus curtisii]NMW46227.1 citramalate synthase [Mobiluncus curtisii]NMW47181.1 citramalate synthase [Mobiluncus curtisii]
MKTTTQPIEIYDTTLRDGAQMEGISLSVADKLNIAQALDDLGVSFIEGGWPGAIPKDTEFFALALSKLQLRHATLAAFGATRKVGTKASEDPQVLALLESGAPVITLVAKSDLRHVTDALKTTGQENLAMVRDTVQFLVKEGRRVFLDAEHYFDGLTHDAEYGLKVLKAAGEAGAETVVLCDTNGGNLPSSIGAKVMEARDYLDKNGLTQVKIGIHTHNDTGCAVANAMAAIEAGAAQVQGCVNGYGERTGNADILTLAGNIEIKLGRPALLNEKGLAELTRTSHRVAEITNLQPSKRLPYVGDSSFAHKAGLHASAIRVNPDLYQHIDPATVGNDMRMLVSEMAGRASVQLKAKELGIDLSGTPYLTGRVVEAVKEKESHGYVFDAADASFELLVRAQGGDLPTYFEVETWRTLVQAGRASLSENGEAEAEATVKLRTRDGRKIVTGEGNGPVNALDHALRQALSQTYPDITNFELVDYKVRILDTTSGTDATVRVLITTTNGDIQWTTVGVGEDVIEASWEALVESLTWGLMHLGVRPKV